MKTQKRVATLARDLPTMHGGWREGELVTAVPSGVFGQVLDYEIERVTPQRGEFNKVGNVSAEFLKFLT